MILVDCFGVVALVASPAAIVGLGQRPLSVVDLPAVKENKMRMIIAGADRSTLTSLGEYFLNSGHESEISRLILRRRNRL